MADYRQIAGDVGLSDSEVKRIVSSFFESLEKEARKLPFDNKKKIFKRNKFNEYVFAVNIPFIGRLGPVYSRYLHWRKNESLSTNQQKKPTSKHGLSEEEIEYYAEMALSGRKVVIPKKKERKTFERIWIVGQDGKRQARQVIKTEKDGI